MAIFCNKAVPAGMVTLLFGLCASAADPALLQMVMPDAKVIIGIDVEASKASPLGELMIERLREEQKSIGLLSESAGFDPRRDLRHVVIASSAVDSGSGRQSGLLLARGQFNIERIVEGARAAGARTVKFMGADIIVTRLVPGSGPAPGWVALLEDSVAVMGDEASVRGALERRDGTTAQIDPRLSTRIQGLSALHHAWFTTTASIASLADQVPGARMNGLMRGELFRSVEEASGGIRFGDDVTIEAEAVTASERDAKAMVDVIRFLAGMVQTNRAGSTAVTTLLDSMELKREGSTMRFTLSMPQGQFEQLLRKPELRGALAPRRTGGVEAAQ